MDESSPLKELLAENARLLQEKEGVQEELENFRSIVACEKVEATFELNKELDVLRSKINMKDHDIRNLKLEHNQKIASLRRDLTAANSRRGSSQNSEFNRGGSSFARIGDGGRRSIPKPPIDLTVLNDELSRPQAIGGSIRSNENKAEGTVPNVPPQQLQKNQENEKQEQPSKAFDSKAQSPRPHGKVVNENEINRVSKISSSSALELSLFMTILVSIQRIASCLSKSEGAQVKDLKRQISINGIYSTTKGANAQNAIKKTGLERYLQICDKMLDWHTKAVRILSSGTTVSLNPIVDLIFEMLNEAKSVSTQHFGGAVNMSLIREWFHLDIFTEGLNLLAVLVELHNPYSAEKDAGRASTSPQRIVGDVESSSEGQNGADRGSGTKRPRTDMEGFLDLFETSRNQMASEDGSGSSAGKRDLRNNFSVAASTSEGPIAGGGRESSMDSVDALDLRLSLASQSLQFPRLSPYTQTASSTDRKSTVSLTKSHVALKKLTRLLSDLGGGSGAAVSAQGLSLRLAAQRTLCRLFWASQVHSEGGSGTGEQGTFQAFLGSSLAPLLAKSLQWADPHLPSTRGQGLAARRDVVEVLTSIFAGNAMSITAFLDSHSSREVFSEALLVPLIAQFRIFPDLSDTDNANFGNFERSLAAFQALVATLLRVLFAAAESEFIAALTVPQLRVDHGDSGLQISASGGPCSGRPAVSDEESNFGGDDGSACKVDYAALSTLSLAWSRSIRALDGAPPLLKVIGAFFEHSALVGHLSKLLNAFAVKVQSSSEDSAVVDFGRELVERVNSTLVRWDTRHHHLALLAYGDDVLELRELLEFYC